MPKVNVACAQDPLQRVEVRWQPDLYVQLATVRCTQPDSEVDRVEGIYLDLDRAGINRLIVSLRRARDYAFGKDA